MESYLVGIHHQDVTPVVTDGLPSDSQSATVLLHVGADLELEVLVALSDTLLQQRTQLILAVTEPPSTSSVCRHSPALFGLLDTLLLGGLDLLEQRNGLLWGDGVCDVAEVNAADELLRSHVRDNAPDGLIEGLGPQIPQSVDHGSQGKVDDTLLGSDPAQLAVGYQVTPCLAPVGGQLVQVLADYQGSEKADGGADNLVSTANGEGLSRSQLVLSLLRANRNTKGLMRTMP